MVVQGHRRSPPRLHPRSDCHPSVVSKRSNSWAPERMPKPKPTTSTKMGASAKAATCRRRRWVPSRLTRCAVARGFCKPCGEVLIGAARQRTAAGPPAWSSSGSDRAAGIANDDLPRRPRAPNGSGASAPSSPRSSLAQRILVEGSSPSHPIGGRARATDPSPRAGQRAAAGLPDHAPAAALRTGRDAGTARPPQDASDGGSSRNP